MQRVGKEDQIFSPNQIVYFFFIVAAVWRGWPGPERVPGYGGPWGCRRPGRRGSGSEGGQRGQTLGFFQCFGSGSFFTDRTFFPSPDPDRGKIRIRKIRILIHEKNDQETVSTSKTILISYLALPILSLFQVVWSGSSKTYLKIVV